MEQREEQTQGYGVTFYSPDQPIEFQTDKPDEHVFLSDQVDIDIGLAYIRGENQGEDLITSEDETVVFIQKDGEVFIGKGGDMDEDDTPFFIDVMIEPAIGIPFKCIMTYPDKGLILETIFTDEDITHEDSWSINSRWRIIQGPIDTIDSTCDLYSVANSKILSRLFFAFKSL